MAESGTYFWPILKHSNVRYAPKSGRSANMGQLVR